MFLNRIVDVVLMVWQKMPPIAFHNLAKASMLKKIFWHLAVDGQTGLYLEFGVAQGNSLKAAVLANNAAKSKIIGVRRINRNYFGFDTFEQFESDSASDIHPTWQGTMFNKSFELIKKRFKKYPEVLLVKVDVLSLKRSYPDPTTLVGKQNFAAVILFDMDLSAPTQAALEWCEPLMQQGTFLVFDEPFAFSGNSQKGEMAAFQKFKAAHPNITFRHFGSYGAGGLVYILDFTIKS